MLPDRSHTLYLEQDTAMALPRRSLNWSHLVSVGLSSGSDSKSEIIMTLGRCDEVQTSSIMSICLPAKVIQISTLQYGPKRANGNEQNRSQGKENPHKTLVDSLSSTNHGSTFPSSFPRSKLTGNWRRGTGLKGRADVKLPRPGQSSQNQREEHFGDVEKVSKTAKQRCIMAA